MKRKHIWVTVTLSTVLMLTLVYVFRDQVIQLFLRPTQSQLPQGEIITEQSGTIKTVATGLTIPWEVVVLPDGDLLVTERTGTLRQIGSNNRQIQIEGVEHIGEGGLLGLALHPSFEENNHVYLYLTSTAGEGLINRVERYTYSNFTLSEKTLIIDNIPGARIHDGGRLAFGPDGKLYIATGDAGVDSLAQDTASLAGKILRLNDDGSIPEDNPFNNEVYSYGHRNPQGLAWDKDGQLWSTEHGPSGLETGKDELNLIVNGGNYGWPLYTGDETGGGTIPPVVQSGSDETWAPASLAYADGSLYFGGLRGQSLYRAVINEDNTVTLSTYFREEYGRLRAVTAADDFLLITTSNQDGRGQPRQEDDKIIKVPLSIIK